MRTERIEETTEANRVAAASVVRGRGRDGVDGVPDPRVARLLPALSRLLSCSTTSPRTAVLAEASELLGNALVADHVGIYLSEQLLEATPDPAPVRGGLRFVLAACYSRRGSAAKPVNVGLEGLDAITLSPDEEATRQLLEGRSTRVFHSFSRGRPALASGLSPAPGWSRIHSTLQVPCLGPKGLLAMITLEGPFSDLRASKALGETIEAAASLLGGHLERDRLANEIAAMRAETARTQRLASLGRVASSVAHDFNNVLTVITGYADLLELELPGGVEGAPESPGRVELDEIRTAAARGAKLVEDVVAFARKRTASDEEVDLALALGRLDGMLRRVAGEGIELQARVEAGLPRVRMELERFERILVNLVANARHAIDACPGRAGRIEIALDGLRGDGDAAGTRSVCLRVRDNGCGMDAIVKRRLFEPFFTTRGAEGGTGLGLADVADFARRAGATIELESTPGAGSELSLRFPAVNGPSRPALPLGDVRVAEPVAPPTAPSPV